MSGTKSHISNDDLKAIEGLFKRIESDKEFEFIFFSKKREEMNKEKYVLLLKFMKAMKARPNHSIVGPEQTLDVAYRAESGQSYRIEITGADEIKTQLRRIEQSVQNRNYVIYKFLLQMLRKGSDNMKLVLKSREDNDNVDIDDLNIRARLSNEYDLTQYVTGKNSKTHAIPKEHMDKVLETLLTGGKLSLEKRAEINQNISFRLKERTSLYFDGAEDGDHFSRIDLTNTKTVIDLQKLPTIYSNYELEIEYGVKSKSAMKLDHLEKIYTMSDMVIKLLQQSAFIVGNTQSDKVIEYYKDMTGLTGPQSGLVARQAVSLEIQHTTEILPNRYAVTDKADGDRYFMIIMDGGVYLISSNLNVKDTGIVLDDKVAEKYNGTILDGEYLYLSSERRHLFMIFDCLRKGSEDLRGELKLMTRLKHADKIVSACFVFGDQTGFEFKDQPTQSKDFDVGKVRDFYGKELARYYKVLHDDIRKVTEYPLIRRKFFMSVTGATNHEIFSYSVEYWKRYAEDPDVKFPYLLDGLIYHPLEQSYNTNAQESKYAEYKWKPPSKNSIDFYIEFTKDKVTNRVLDVYDNSDADEAGKTDEGDDAEVSDKMIRNKTYRICTLHVGQTLKGKEYPVPFTKNGVSDCYIYLADGEARDDSGDILSDKTVVEFYYQNDPSIIPQQRWVPIKTRFDKTESVERYGKRYGNYSSTADRIWRSIINPVLMSDMQELSHGGTRYDRKIANMNSKIDHDLIVEVNKENKYYQKQSKLAASMRNYHNFIKSNLIYTYCNKMYNSNNQLSVLDVACGRGGDINKFYYTNVASLVGIDIDSEGIKSPVDGAISRYNRQRKKKPNYPSMYFIQADARSILEYDTQISALSGMDDMNKKLLDRFFPATGKKTLFDRINCQFAIHYFFENDQTWSNFKTNLNNHLRAGGYFMVTTFDAKEVIKAIGSNDRYSAYLDDESGTQKLFFEVVKKYKDEDVRGKIGTGQAIDLHAAWMFNEGVYVTEYLVDIDFIREELDRDCDMEIVDEDLFKNQMAIHKPFLTDAADYESTKDTRNYLQKTGRFYEDTDVNIKCREFTNLERYYVFRKRGRSDPNMATGVKAAKGDDRSRYQKKGGGNNNQTVLNFGDEGLYRIPEMDNYDSRISFLNSLHKIMVSHSMIPKAIRVNEFVEDQGMACKTDVDTDTGYIRELAQKMTIDHEIGGKIQNVVKGLSIYVVERDCNDFYDVEFTKTNGSKSKNRNNRAVILMKEGMTYKPVMRREEKGIRGMFKCSDPLIRELELNGDEM